MTPQQNELAETMFKLIEFAKREKLALVPYTNSTGTLSYVLCGVTINHAAQVEFHPLGELFSKEGQAGIKIPQIK